MLNAITDKPDWRYGTALLEMERESAGLPVYEPVKDKGVDELKRVLPLYYRSRLDRDMVQSKDCNGAYTLLLDIYRDTSVGGLRDTIEAVFLTGDADVDFFQEQVSRHLDTKLVEMYRYLFYDIEADRNKPFWVHRNIFMPNKEIGSLHKFNTAYMWKVVAYHGGTEKWRQYALDGIPMSDEFALWFRDLGVSEHVKTVLKSIHSNAKLLDGAGTPATHMTSDWHKRADAPDDSGPGDIGMLTEVKGAIANAISRPDASFAQEAELLGAY